MSARFLFLRQLTALALLAGGVMTCVNLVRAEQTPQTEVLTIPVGSVFEILAQEGTPGTQYAWVLSMERTFLQAGRGRSLRTRFSQPGRYLLSAEVSPPGGKAIRSSFTMMVESGLTALEPATPIETAPVNINGSITLEDNQRLVLLHPATGMLTGITLDSDLSVDENGDGNLENDPSAEGTFLASDSLPLYLWITKDPPVSFAVNAVQADGSAYVHQFTATTGDVVSSASSSASSQDAVPVTGGIDITEERDGSLRFHIQELPPANTPVLPVWDFGDGTQSMLMEPVHTYAASGTYIVRVRLKDLRNGIDIRDLRQSVRVEAPAVTPVPQNPKPEPDPNPETPAPEKPDTGSSLFPMLLKIFIGLVVAVVLGTVTTMVLMKLRKGKSLAERLEDADKKMVIGKDETLSGVAPPPMSLIAPTKEPTPLLTDSGMPDWLTPKGEKKAATVAAPVAPSATLPVTPTPTSQPLSPPAPKPAPAPTPAPVPAPVKASPGSSPDGPLPAWLQPNTETAPVKPAASTPAPAPVPAPISPPPTVPAPVEQPALPKNETPQPAPKPFTAEETGSLPAWLQPQTPKPPPQEAPPAPASAGKKPEPPAPAPAPTPKAPPASPAPAPTPKEVPPVTPPASPQLETPASVPAPTTPPVTEKVSDNPPSPVPVKAPQAAVPAAPKVLSEKERERRRLKRQRYRQNKQRRETVATQESAPGSTLPAPSLPDDAPVAFIHAESIERKPSESNPHSTPQ